MTDWQYEYNRLVNSAMQLNRMYKSKSKRIERAIEYIEKNTTENEAKFYGIPDYKVFNGLIDDVLEILKGVDKE